MKICVVQADFKAGDIQESLTSHRKHIITAVSHDAELLVFPELSLMGYEPTLVAELAMNSNDHRLDGFQELSDRYRVVGLFQSRN